MTDSERFCGEKSSGSLSKTPKTPIIIDPLQIDVRLFPRGTQFIKEPNHGQDTTQTEKSESRTSSGFCQGPQSQTEEIQALRISPFSEDTNDRPDHFGTVFFHARFLRPEVGQPLCFRPLPSYHEVIAIHTFQTFQFAG